jgi:hypothetical protein
MRDHATLPFARRPTEADEMAARKCIDRNAAPLDVEQSPGYDPLVTAADRRPSAP